MKFGRNLHQHVVPAWADCYVDYNRLKRILASNTELPVFSTALHHEADLVNAFCTHTISHLQSRLDTVAKRYHVKIGTSESHLFDSISKPELEDLQLSLVEITEQLSQLEWYWRVNDEATNLLIDKAVAVYGSEAIVNASLAPSHFGTASPCMPQLALINATLEALHHALNDKQQERRRSLFVERVLAKPSRRSASTDVLLAVHEDEESALQPLIDDASNVQPLLRAFLQVAIAHHSYNCQRLLLSTLGSQIRAPVSKKHDYLHRIIRRLRHSIPEKAGLEFRDALDAVAPADALLLESPDSRGRLPLHHAAELGMDFVCREIWARGKAWGKMVLWSPDATGATPLDLAVRAGHTEVVTTLMQHLTTSEAEAERMAVSPLLSVAIMSGFEDIARVLLARRWGINFTLRDGRTVLHLAAEQGLPETVEALCKAHVDVNSKESTRERTPLIAAAVQGHTDVVTVLLGRGADLTVLDADGWSAKDHAAYRGYLKMSAALGAAKMAPLVGKPSNRRGTRNILPKDLGHDESVIFVTPGTADLFKEAKFVDVAPFHAKISPVQVPDTSLWMTITAIGCQGQTHSIRLPALEESLDWPWIFRTKAPENAKLVFRLYSQFQTAPVGTAVALLASLKQGLGPDRESLVRDFTVPFIDADADYIGQVTFTFLVSKPYVGKPLVAFDQELRTPEFTEVGGHRGNGWNDGKRGNLQIGENTIQSFRTAADLGATCVEFDVQLTKDHIPMVYHDFLVAEAGIDAAMHNLTYDQFMALADPQASSEPSYHLAKNPGDSQDRPGHFQRRRSRSISARDNPSDALIGRMRRTFGYQGWKANCRNENIYEPFITLKQLYENLSEDVDLSIEIKYPMLSEARDFLLDAFAPELNMVIDIILEVTAAYAGSKRRITLSSFNPEICMAVAAKQSTYPVMFLNDSCNNPTGDFRATSVQTAARLAHRFGMVGVGMAAEPFVEAPGLIPFVKDQGMYTMSYGALNDAVENSKTQAQLGLDLLIVNRVKLIKKTLAEMRV